MAEVIRFARSLYAREAIERTAAEFAELARIQVTEDNDSIDLVLEDPDPELAEVLADEIANHALFLTVRQARS